ncbi:hypothetical protein BJF90_12075 [Pseudonocardia sp. CNS-004]|nr:hypothetical protein BJF90_12075 [Pseudonocardia sp. CNS-004]
MSPPVLLNIARPAGEVDAVALAARALAAGLDGVGLADSPRLFPDPLVETARVLAGTDARLAGPCVLGLGLRHPATVASAVRTLATHHPGRVLAVVGRGESSVRNEGLPVPSLRDHRAAMRAVRELAGAATLLGAASGLRTIAGDGRRARWGARRRRHRPGRAGARRRGRPGRRPRRRRVGLPAGRRHLVRRRGAGGRAARARLLRRPDRRRPGLVRRHR